MDLAPVARQLRSHPVLVGALAGLGVGLVGLLSVRSNGVSYLGGMSGAIAGGATAAYLSDGDLRTDVRRAIAADVLSSIAFFLGAVVWLATAPGYVASVSFEAVVMAAGYVFFGSFVAVPVALFSLCIAAAAGGLTSLATGDGSGGQETLGTSRK